MEEDTNRECTNDQCINMRENLVIAIKERQRARSELERNENYVAECQRLQYQLQKYQEDEARLQATAEKAYQEAEEAKIHLNRLEKDVEYYKGRYEELAPQEEEAKKHFASAQGWRDKYDNMGALAEQLEEKVDQIQQKYVQTVALLTQVQKKSSQQATQLENAKRTASDLNDYKKNLNKYLKDAVFLIDSLSRTANLSKQPKKIKELVETFRRDDVRAFFNTPMWKNSSGLAAGVENEGDEDQSGELQNKVDSSSSDAAKVDALGLTLSDEEEEEEEHVNESFVAPPRPDLKSKWNALKAKKNHVERVNVEKLTDWPKGVRKPNKDNKGDERDYGIIDPKKVHTKSVPLLRSKKYDFDLLNNAASERKKALLDRSDGAAPSSSAVESNSKTNASIHGKKGKTVHEQQTEMMKVSVKEKVARMKALGVGSSQKKEDNLEVNKNEVEMNGLQDQIKEMDMSASPAKTTERKRVNESFTLSEASDLQEDFSVEMEFDVELANITQTDIQKDENLSTEKSRKSTLRPRRKSEVVNPSPRSSRSRSRASSVRSKSNRRCASVNPKAKQSVPPSPTPNREERAQLRASRTSSTKSENELTLPSGGRKSRIEQYQTSEKTDIPAEKFTNLTKELDPSLILEGSRLRSSQSFLQKSSSKTINSKAPSSASSRAPSSDSISSRTRRSSCSQTPKPVSKKDVSNKTPQKNISRQASRSSSVASNISRRSLRSNGPPKLESSQSNESITESGEKKKKIKSPPTEARWSSRIAGIAPAQPAPSSSVSRKIEPRKKIATNVDLNMGGVPMRVRTAPIKQKGSKKTAQKPKAETKAVETEEKVEEAASTRMGTNDQEKNVSEPLNHVDLGTKSTEEKEKQIEMEKEVSMDDAKKEREIDAIVEKQIRSEPSTGIETETEIASETKQPTVEIGESSQPSSSRASDGEERHQPEISLDPTLNIDPVGFQPPEKDTVGTKRRAEINEDGFEGPVEKIIRVEEKEKTNEVVSGRDDGEAADAFSSNDQLVMVDNGFVHNEHFVGSFEKKTLYGGGDVLKDADENGSEQVMLDDGNSSSDDELRIEDSDEEPALRKKTEKSVVVPPSVPTTNIEKEVVTEKETGESVPIQVVSSTVQITSLNPPTEPDKASTSSVENCPTVKERPVEPIAKMDIDCTAPKKRIAHKSVEEMQKELGLIMSDSDEEDDEDLKLVGKKDEPKEIKQVVQKISKPPMRSSKPAVIDALPVGRKRPQTLAKAVVEKSTAKSSKLTVSTPTVVPASVVVPPSDVKKSAILIEPMGKGRRGKAAAKQQAGAKNVKGGRMEVKKSGARAQLRQALDLKLPVQELKRPMEEKGFILDGSIPLPAEEAADVMMEFLKETSPSDMWMVLVRRKVEGNAAPLVNNDEQNFLNVSVSLNDDDQSLLRIFIERLLFEFATRDSLNSTQCGCYTRLMCHAVRFIEVENEQKFEWMKRLMKILFLKHEAQSIKGIAYCLNSDSSEFCKGLVDDLEDENESSLVFRSLLHTDQDQAGVVNWLMNIKFQTPYITSLKEKEIASRAKVLFDKFCNQRNVIVGENEAKIDEDAIVHLTKAIRLAKTGDSDLLQYIFNEMKALMSKLENQFAEDDPDNGQPRNIFSLPSSVSTITAADGREILLKFEWLKSMMLVFIENSHSSLWQTVIAALTEISVQIVRIRECVTSKEIEKIDRSGRIPVKQSVLDMCNFISEFTTFPLMNGSV